MTTVLFPSHPIKPKEPEMSFESEAGAARKVGLSVGLVDVEMMLGGEVKLRGEWTGTEALYRGWLMKPTDYQRMEDAIRTRAHDMRLVTSTEQYLEAYLLPRWYWKLGPPVTPRSLILPDLPESAAERLDVIAEMVGREFGSGPCLLKDYVKSQKHRWFDACFIRNADDVEEVKRIVAAFLKLTGPDLVGGLVFREYVSLKQIGISAKMHLPLVNEWRAFVRFGRVIYLCPYWYEADYDGCVAPSVEEIEAISAPLRHLPFIAVDVAESSPEAMDRGAPKWPVMEVNDGGAAGMPKHGRIGHFYRALVKALAADQ